MNYKRNPVFKDLTGQVFGRLTAQWPVGIHRHYVHWLCLCECGGLKTILGINLSSGNSQSCGCQQKKKPAHGHCRRIGTTPEYRSWLAMRTRCTNPNSISFKYYGAKNVMVCDRWFNSFKAFFEDMGPRPAGTSLGRFGDVGNYEPGNCAWQTRAEQHPKRKKAA